MTRSKSNQVKKDPSSPVDDIAFGEEYVEYGGSLNAERTALSLTEDSSNSSSSSSSNDEGEMQPSQESYRDSDQGKARKPHGEPVSTRSQPISDDDSSSDEGLFTQMPIRPRQRFTTQEISILEKVYQKNGRPSAEMKQNLADKLDTTVNRIQIWFQNRRAKEKKTQEQSKSSADGPCTTSVPDINEPESSTRISSELRTRRSSAENSRQVPSKNEAKGRADDSGERYQEKSRHIEKKKPARQLVEDNPQSHIEHSVYPLANPPHTYYRYTPTMELIPPFYWPSHPLSYQPPRIGPSSSSPQPGQQGMFINQWFMTSLLTYYINRAYSNLCKPPKDAEKRA
jgi:hypothetical protein